MKVTVETKSKKEFDAFHFAMKADITILKMNKKQYKYLYQKYSKFQRAMLSNGRNRLTLIYKCD